MQRMEGQTARCVAGKKNNSDGGGASDAVSSSVVQAPASPKVQVQLFNALAQYLGRHMVHHARKKVPALERGQVAGAGPDGGFSEHKHCDCKAALHMHTTI